MQLVASDQPNTNGKDSADARPDVEVMSVTPEMAAIWLGNGGNNRNLSQRTAAHYARQMTAGLWKLSFDPIRLDSQCRVRDGQHRLAAVIKSGVTLTTLVVRGIAEDTFDIIDTGRARKVRDVLSIHGHSQATSRAATIKALYCWELGGSPFYMRAITQLTAPETLALLPLYPEMDFALEQAGMMRKAGFFGGRGMWAAVFVRLIRIDEDAERTFTEKLVAGANLAAGDPVLVLRSALTGYIPRGYGGQEAMAAMAIKAWNLSRSGGRAQLLTWKRVEAFPVPR